MHKKSIVMAGIIAALLPKAGLAADDAELQQIHQEIQQLKQNYEARIKALELKLAAAETASRAPQPAAAQPPAQPNSFNPAISLILSGTYGNLSQNPAGYKISGFADSGNQGPGPKGFSLRESELGVYSNIDPYWYGGLNLALTPQNTVSVEEAFIQSLGFGSGMTLKAGRFFSGIGYLNDQHAHTWDFVDNPLAYQAFLGTQLGEDGVQLKWLLPTTTFIEAGGEIGRGRLFPGTNSNAISGKNGIGAGAIYVHVGGDIGDSGSWRAGVSTLQTSPQQRLSTDINLAGAPVTNSFTGNNRTNIADFVWKWAPNGDFYRSYLKLQGEYLQRRETGSLIYDTGVTNSPGAYASSQSGWYLQGVYQFMPYWRVGLRTEQLDSGTVNLGANSANLPAIKFRPKKNSVMLDYSPSEFSRFRLQYAQDQSRLGLTDNQLFIQYIVSLGAHGAHSY